MEQQARERVRDSEELTVYEEVIFYDWPNWDEHMEWIATAPEAEIIDWVEDLLIEVSGDRYEVGERAWERWGGSVTPEEFMEGYESVDTAVSEYIESIPDAFGEQPGWYSWREMNGLYSLESLLTYYLEDYLEGNDD